ncbi:CAAX protease self-immunity [Micrococcales bacterium KH10]|nr:CAAX protease self-immunity [Micrococcales bacterium KH10]
MVTNNPARRHLTIEVWLVLALSLGQSAVYAVVNLAARLATPTPLSQQSTTMNSSRAEMPWLDLTYQLLAIFFALVPVALALYLLARSGSRPFADLGLNLRRPRHDIGHGLVLAAVIGLPGLGLYVAGRALGITVEIQAAALQAVWWAVPILILRAIMNALLEEVIVVGYLGTRLRQLGWASMWIITASALLRGAYHLYQGFGPFIGNVVMGIVFGWYFIVRRGGRVMPLVIAHTLLDVVSFVGYQLVPDSILARLGIG